jgi:hypothetical protein
MKKQKNGDILRLFPNNGAAADLAAISTFRGITALKAAKQQTGSFGLHRVHG